MPLNWFWNIKEKKLLDREGSKHSIFVNTQTGDWTSVPRHPDIREKTVMKICKELGIPILK